MPALEISLPLDPLHTASYWAWLIALCVATIATLSRLSLLSFVFNSKPINRLLSSREAQLHHQLAMKEHFPSEAEHTTSEQFAEAPCTKQEGGEKGSPWSILHQRWEACSGGRKEEEEEEEEEEEREVPPPWLYSLLEASRTPLEEVCISSPPRLVHVTRFTSWSQGLHRHTSARVEMPWYNTETRVGMPWYSTDTRRVSSCEENQVLHLLQIPSISPTISAVHARTHHGFVHVGFRSGEMTLWDVEKRLCLNRFRGRTIPITALDVAPSHPSAAIAAGSHHLNRNSTVVSVWDDRCALRSADITITTLVSPTTALKCRGDEFCIAGNGYLSMHDTRMLKEKPIFLYIAPPQGRRAWGGQGNGQEDRGLYFREEHDVEQELEEPRVMERVSFSYLDGSHGSSKSRCTFLTNCLSFMCRLSSSLFFNASNLDKNL